ncbi:PHB depolymerase family esterase [uncultured Maribacter sp.]|uniref:alpha/beta hydrolase family esterase n=1 Tax=uncultured Maribacter sp. TaxID=431308 RepID=UPI00260CC34E|nr:PHB depolymerase family esterase [uncultured Maribacter sp.]
MKTTSIFIALILLFGCIKREDNTNQETEKGLLQNQKINISGESREYHIYVPATPENAPIVVLLHGHSGSSDQILGLENTKAPFSVWLNIAEQENIILLVPNGKIGASGHQGWNDCREEADGNPTTDDVAFISNLIDTTISSYNANPEKVFINGISNGGHMSYRLAQEIPNKLKAFAAIVASKPVNSTCTDSTTPISALIMNGTEDPLVPYNGGQVNGDRGLVFSTEETVAYWVNRNNTQTTPIITNLPNTNTTDNSTVTKYSYTNGTNNSEVVFYKITGGGHTEPSLEERYGTIYKLIVKEQNGDIEMAEKVWDFFKTK